MAGESSEASEAGETDEAGEAGDEGDDGVSALDGVPRKLLSEIDAAVVDLIEGSPRRRARARRRR